MKTKLPQLKIPTMAISPEDSDSEDEPSSSNHRSKKADQAVPRPSTSSSNSSSAPFSSQCTVNRRPYTTLDELRAHCVIDQQPFWLVEEVKDVRMDPKGKLFYLVKWDGYSENDNSWEPEENCALARRLIAEFHQKSSNKTSDIARQMLLSNKAKMVATNDVVRPAGPPFRPPAPAVAATSTAPTGKMPLQKPMVKKSIGKHLPYERLPNPKSNPKTQPAVAVKPRPGKRAMPSSTQDSDSNHSGSMSIVSDD